MCLVKTHPEAWRTITTDHHAHTGCCVVVHKYIQLDLVLHRCVRLFLDSFAQIHG